MKPDFVTITSWNEWHEGTAIEPAKVRYLSSSRSYDDFAPLSNTYYMSKTAEWIKNLEAKEYSPLSGQKIRLTVETTSDWLDLEIEKGELIRPESFKASGSLTRASFTGTHFYANQSIDNASANQSLSMKLVATSLENLLTVKAKMGAIGATKLVIEIYDGRNWIKKNELAWSGTMSNGSEFSAPLI